MYLAPKFFSPHSRHLPQPWPGRQGLIYYASWQAFNREYMASTLLTEDHLGVWEDTQNILPPSSSCHTVLLNARNASSEDSERTAAQQDNIQPTN